MWPLATRFHSFFLNSIVATLVSLLFLKYVGHNNPTSGPLFLLRPLPRMLLLPLIQISVYMTSSYQENLLHYSSENLQASSPPLVNVSVLLYSSQWDLFVISFSHSERYWSLLEGLEAVIYIAFQLHSMTSGCGWKPNRLIIFTQRK